MSDAVVTTLAEAIAKGVTIEAACGLAGIHRRTFFTWQELGLKALAKQERGEELTRNERDALRFILKIQEAEAKAELYHIEIINEAAKGNPQYSRWWLSRRRRAAFGDDAPNIQRTVGALEVIVRFEDVTPTYHRLTETSSEAEAVSLLPDET
jgi:hypothetical protein